MIPSRKSAAILLTALAVVAAALSIGAELHGQLNSSSPPTGPAGWPINHTLIVLDPAHGGSDSGAVLGDHVFEKDVTLIVALKLKAALTANGFTVVTTRDADVSNPLSTDQRAEIANRMHAVACLVLHATATGSGVHIYTSDLLAPTDPGIQNPSAYVPIPWETAQVQFVRQSVNLAGGLSNALGKNHLPTMIGHAPMRPLDNLMCPAVAIELAPLSAPGVGTTAASDASYQQQLANSLAGALRVWRDSPDLSPTVTAGQNAQANAQAQAIAAAEVVGRAAARVRTPESISQAAQRVLQ